jgi:hypothetical protein
LITFFSENLWTCDIKFPEFRNSSKSGTRKNCLQPKIEAPKQGDHLLNDSPQESAKKEVCQVHLATKNRPIRSSYVCSNYVTLQHYNYFFKKKSANIFTVLLEFPILIPLGTY